ncbi:flagellar basal-body MS-ring/collar protein FliF [Lentisphaerota bacterium WC36G]|nr:flagellar M-ring protein FliF [Lentisphaerae bacterium WC36]
MDRLFNSIANSLSEIWRNIGLSQKVSIILIFIIAFSLAIAGITYFLRTDWGVLYSNLDDENSAQVLNIIQDNGIKYKLESGGRRILVPSEHVNMLRIRCQSTGVMTKDKGVGFELFDNAQLGLTDRQQQVMWLRGKQGELQRMLNQIPEVSGSRVLLSYPERTVFSRNKKRPSASIMLVLKKGFSLSPQQVQAIKSTVAGSVTDMTESDVTITDNRGRLLSRKEYDGIAGSGGSTADRKAKIEFELKEKVEALLRPSIGMDNVIAQVSCDIDFNNVDRITESYNTEQAAVISEKTTIDDSSRMNPNGAGAVGISANRQQRSIGSGQSTAATNNNKMFSEQRKTSELKYVIPKIVEKQITKGEKIKNISVAVTINQLKDQKPRTAEQIMALKQTIANAVGLSNIANANIANQISIIESPFIPIEPAAIEPIPFVDRLDNYIEKIFSAKITNYIGGLIMLILLWTVFKRYFNKTMVAATDFVNNNIEYSNQEYLPGQHAMNSDAENGDKTAEIEQLDPEHVKLGQYELQPPLSAKELEVALSKVDAKDVADVLENWIASEA